MYLVRSTSQHVSYLFGSVVLDDLVVGAEVESGHEPVDRVSHHGEVVAAPTAVLQRQPTSPRVRGHSHRIVNIAWPGLESRSVL